ncbi:MAG: hypothetical protein FD168_2419 [Desulfobulbaceae bacterium]|nr:MAG: hypothetical protein FD168_2419 [Desulfobulbaceae bacterium]
MKKDQLSKTLLATALLGAVCGSQAMAGSGGPVTMEALQQQMQELIKENRQLTQRVGELEGKMSETNARTAEKLQALDKGEEKTDPKNNFNSFDTSTVELGLDIKATDWATGHVLLKYEEDGDDDDFSVDEATITLGDTEKFPLTLTAGKFYMPFGNFATNMIQDPLTLEISEINDSGAAIGFEANGFTAALYGYKGMKETDVDDPDDNSYTKMGYGFMAGYGYEKDDTSFTGGVSWKRLIFSVKGPSPVPGMRSLLTPQSS